LLHSLTSVFVRPLAMQLGHAGITPSVPSGEISRSVVNSNCFVMLIVRLRTD
jgi:hypothetical protein